MKSILVTCSSVLVAILLFSFANKNEVDVCYTSFTTASNLSASGPDRLPVALAKTRKVKTDSGEVDVTRVDGYRMLYINEKKAMFVNMKVEVSEEGAYETDKKNLLANLKYLNAHASTPMESKELIEKEFNGYKIYGFSRATLEVGNTLGTFLMFPGNGHTVYFYFNNMNAEYRSFADLDGYKQHRDKFLEEYTKYVAGCKKN
jgi:hypothetical protein